MAIEARLLPNSSSEKVISPRRELLQKVRDISIANGNKLTALELRRLVRKKEAVLDHKWGSSLLRGQQYRDNCREFILGLYKQGKFTDYPRGTVYHTDGLKFLEEIEAQEQAYQEGLATAQKAEEESKATLAGQGLNEAKLGFVRWLIQHGRLTDYPEAKEKA